MNFEGVARKDGKVYFVPYSLIGEEVLAEVVENKKKFANARISELKTTAKERVQPLCPYFYECGGCDIQHLFYDKQLEYKTKHIKETLEKVAEIQFDVKPTIKSENNYFYRNKASFVVVDENGKTKVGMFKHNSHGLVDINQCFLMNDNITKAYKIIKDYILTNNIKGYDFTKHCGELKFVVIRSIGEQTLVALVVTKKIKWANDLYKQLNKEFSNIGLVLCYNKSKNSTILSNDYEFVEGIKQIDLEEFGIKYDINIASFLQVNNEIKNKIYTQVLNEIDNEIVVDAYAGAGLLSAILATKAKRVYSIEIVKQASESAEKLKISNNIKNLEIINGDCSIIVPKVIKDIEEDFTIVLDPARVGCDEKVINVAKNAKKIIYISCNPIALAKDLKTLTLTHNIKYIQPFDMFPQTKHVETLVMLEIKG